MSPSLLAPGVTTKLAYRKPPPSPEFLETPISLYTTSDTFRDEREVFVRDVRDELHRFTIEKEGLEFLHDPVDIQNWDDEDEVREVLLKKTPELILKRLGAKSIFLTAERIRRSVDNSTKSDTTPVFAIHGDATRQSGLELLRTSLEKMSPTERSKLNLPPSLTTTTTNNNSNTNTGRVMLINVWRPLKTITRDPLGFLVPSSINASEERHEQLFSRPADTFKVFGKPLGDYWLDTASYGEQHEWVFLRHQKREEPVMFVQWDSEGVEEGKFENRMSVFHSCFEDEEYCGDEGRASMELKCLVFF